MPVSADLAEHVLHEAQIDPIDHRQEHSIALGVLAAVRAQVAVGVDQRSNAAV